MKPEPADAGGYDDMVQIRNITYAYPQRPGPLGPFQFSADPGDIVHVTGSSGCGKSTLARCITGLIPHIYRGEMRGEVIIDGNRTSDTPLWRLSELAGLVFQNPAAQMLGSSVEEEIIIGLENLGLEKSEISGRLEDALERFALGPLRSRSPRTLSGGEQQKLALAAMTARRPPLLVLDEPLSMLDVTAASELVGYLAELAKSGTAIVIMEHRADYLAGLRGVRVHDLDRDRPRRVPDRRAPRPDVPDAGGKRRRLEVSGLGVNIGRAVILKDLNFTVSEGTVTAVVGRNGTGKTTLLRALAGLQDHAGSAAIDGARPDFGLVFQNAELQLFNPTVRGEVLFRIDRPDLVWYEWLMDVLGLRRYENTAPLLLSEGEKKRAALAAVLMRKPSHGLLLDEPSLGQDTGHKAMLMDICAGAAARGMMVILTTHDLHLASMADRLILLDAGGIAADGPPERVFRDRPAWERAGMFVPPWISCRKNRRNTA